CGHNRGDCFDPAIRVECGDLWLCLAACEGRQESKRAVWNHGYVERVCLRRGRYVASAAGNRETASALSTQKRPAKGAIRKSSVGDAAGRDRHEVEAKDIGDIKDTVGLFIEAGATGNVRESYRRRLSVGAHPRGEHNWG